MAEPTKNIEEVIVIGGSVAGLAAALTLAEQGLRIRVYEKDPGPLPQTRVEAFEHWNRKGAPQVRTSHGFLARLRNLLKDDFPALYQELLDEGAYDMPLAELWPPTIEGPDEQPGDEEICMLACRRITFDWVLRRHVGRLPNVEVISGARVSGLISESGQAPTRIGGVRVSIDGGELEPHHADLVVDASGRRTPLDTWLEDVGAPRPRMETEHCGYFLCSRFYRLREGVDEPAEARGFNAVDLGYMNGLLVRGDSKIFSIMMATPKEDADLRQLLKPEVFDAAARAVPLFEPWIEQGRAEAVTDVRGFGQLMNTRRWLVDEAGEPIALGIVAVGDASCHTNPGYGRGVAQGFVHAQMLARAVAESGADPGRAVARFEQLAEEELGVWYRHAVRIDRMAAKARARAAAHRPEARSKGQVNPDEFMRSVMSEGFGVAMRTDPVVFRAGMRVYNMLAEPKTMMENPEIMKRVMEVWRRKDQRKPVINGPEREQMLEILRGAA